MLSKHKLWIRGSDFFKYCMLLLFHLNENWVHRPRLNFISVVCFSISPHVNTVKKYESMECVILCKHGKKADSTECTQSHRGIVFLTEVESLWPTVHTIRYPSWMQWMLDGYTRLWMITHTKRFLPWFIAVENMRWDVNENMWPNADSRIAILSL